MPEYNPLGNPLFDKKDTTKAGIPFSDMEAPEAAPLSNDEEIFMSDFDAYLKAEQPEYHEAKEKFDWVNWMKKSETGVYEKADLPPPPFRGLSKEDIELKMQVGFFGKFYLRLFNIKNKEIKLSQDLDHALRKLTLIPDLVDAPEYEPKILESLLPTTEANFSARTKKGLAQQIENNRQELKKRLELLKNIYIEMRKMGYSHDKLTK